MLRRVVAIILLMLAVGKLTAQNYQFKSFDNDTIRYTYTPIDQGYAHGNSSGRSLAKLLTGKPLAISILPIYTLETNLGIALSAKYSQQKFAVSAAAIATLSGYYNIAVEGNNIIHSRHNIGYGAKLLSSPSRLWGLTFDSASSNSYHGYTSRELGAWIEYRLSLTTKTALSICADYSYINIPKADVEVATLLDDEQLTISSAGISANLSYDSRRKASHYQQQGIYTNIGAKYHPQILSNIDGDIWHFGATFDYYQPLWKGGTIALDIYGGHVTENTPFLLQNELGGNSRMRGYYPGRFRGNTLLSTQLELRQHIWQGIGMVAWGGAGTVFSPNDRFAWRKILPTYGIGLRYCHELLTIRADVGFGRKSFNIILGIGEAF